MLCLVLSLTFTGCTTTIGEGMTTKSDTIDTFTKELRQNDYRGGYTRSIVIKELVLSIVEEMKQNNESIRTENPNSYWVFTGHQDFVSSFLDSTLANDTQWFNEEETTFEEVKAQMQVVPNSFTKTTDSGLVVRYPDMLIERVEKDEYQVSNIRDSWLNDNKKYSGNFFYKVLYDCDKDWCKSYCSLDLEVEGIPDITTELFEYARASKDIFLIQTSTERLYVKLKAIEQDVDLREREVEEFYYSRLSVGQRTTFTPYEPMADEEWMATGYDNTAAQFNKLMDSYPIVNLEGDLATRYGINDSMFAKNAVFTKEPTEWVFEDKALQQTIVYKNGNLVVTTFNKLSEEYEQYIYYRGEKADPEVIKLTPIGELVGIQPIPEEG